MKSKLESYSETKNGKEIFFLQYLKEKPVNLSAKTKVEINEVEEIYNNDLVFISESEDNLVGIYSYKKKKVVFPFIIREFDTKDKSGFIYLALEEGRLESETELNLNPSNDFAYLNTDGSTFQNEGLIFEKLGKFYYMLKDERLGADFIGEDWSYKLYSTLFDSEDCIGYRGIYSYDYDEEANELSMRFDKRNNGKELVIKLSGKRPKMF